MEAFLTVLLYLQKFFQSFSFIWVSGNKYSAGRDIIPTSCYSMVDSVTLHTSLYNSGMPYFKKLVLFVVTINIFLCLLLVTWTYSLEKLYVLVKCLGDTMFILITKCWHILCAETSFKMCIDKSLTENFLINRIKN